MRRWIFPLSGYGDDRCGGGSRKSGGAAAATSTTYAARAFRRTDRVAAGAGTARVCVNAGVILVALAEGIHAAHRAAAWSPGVRDDVGRRAH
jgi:hypothetical protein